MSMLYDVDARQWSMGPVHVCSGSCSKRISYKISSITPLYSCRQTTPVCRACELCNLNQLFWVILCIVRHYWSHIYSRQKRSLGQVFSGRHHHQYSNTIYSSLTASRLQTVPQAFKFFSVDKCFPCEFVMYRGKALVYALGFLHSFLGCPSIFEAKLSISAPCSSLSVHFPNILATQIDRLCLISTDFVVRDFGFW